MIFDFHIIHTIAKISKRSALKIANENLETSRSYSMQFKNKNLIILLLCMLCVCGHEYGAPIESVQKCLNTAKSKRHPIHNESFVKFTCLTAGFGNRLYVYIAARAAAYRFNKTFLQVRSQDAAVLLALNFDPHCQERFIDEVNLDGVKFQPHKPSWVEYNEHILNASTSYEVDNGYMQSYKFTDFPNIREKMWKGLEFQKSKITDDADACMMKYKSGHLYNAPLVCVHIRLGDKFETYRNPDETVRYGNQVYLCMHRSFNVFIVE
mmetsp:Transcript_29269/g.40234  ORF Transcript_29269/g.40234 Transcript_29269/m.40234 type:complete len:266 (+) Transcript_29269:150-947(+)